MTLSKSIYPHYPTSKMGRFHHVVDRSFFQLRIMLCVSAGVEATWSIINVQIYAIRAHC